MTNLKKANDHPSAILRHAGPQQAVVAVKTGYAIAAAALQTYEREHDVTFAALSDEGLADLQVVWQAYRLTPTNDRSSRVQSLLQIADIVGDLLGLDDEGDE